MSYLVPTVVENTPRGERAFDIYSRLLEDRIIFIGSVLTDTLANIVIAQLLFFQGDEAPETAYADRKGKYQGQRGPTPSRYFENFDTD